MNTSAPLPTAGPAIRPARATGNPAWTLSAFRLACWLAGAVGIACGIYMTLRPSSILSEIAWLPRGVAHWADNYGRLRNLPAYATLALPFMFVRRGWRARAVGVACLAVLGATLEGLQYFLPTRWCEWQDVAWSWCGLAVTWIAAEIGFMVARRAGFSWLVELVEPPAAPAEQRRGG